MAFRDQLRRLYEDQTLDHASFVSMEPWLRFVVFGSPVGPLWSTSVTYARRRHLVGHREQLLSLHDAATELRRQLDEHLANSAPRPSSFKRN